MDTIHNVKSLNFPHTMFLNQIFHHFIETKHPLNPMCVYDFTAFS